jgi:uncharacterized protein (TIGR02996 family)
VSASEGKEVEMPTPPDLPALLAAIGERPDEKGGWLALASWLWDNGRDLS